LISRSAAEDALSFANAELFNEFESEFATYRISWA
jgi:hypothetical protein